jgi:hypothetical protein
MEHMLDRLTGAAADNAGEHKLWNRVCYRLDTFCLIIGQLMNISIAIIWLQFSKDAMND